MTDWHSNLIREYVPSPPHRRAMYVGMIAYLALSGLALVATAFHATQKLVRTVHEARKVHLLEQKFRPLYGNLEGDLTEVARELEAKIEQTQAQLEEVDTQLSGQINFTKILAGVRLPLPHDVKLVGLNLNATRGVIEFDVVMPDAPAEEDSRARALVNTWNAFPLLNTEVREIEIVALQTQRVKDHSVVVLRLKGQLARGKG